MDLNLIRKLVKLVDSSEITDLEIEEDGLRVKIGKKIRDGQAVTQPQILSPSQPVTEQTSELKLAEAAAVAVQEEKKETLHEIHSPIVGTFYRAPAPDADPYVQVGDSISAGAVLCIVEAMKLMNEIESDVGGKIVKILVENGKPVEYNQPLFLIQPG
jgi:acetyl-CoA carboxylase biotin carboxyl carrier protein